MKMSEFFIAKYLINIRIITSTAAAVELDTEKMSVNLSKINITLNRLNYMQLFNSQCMLNHLRDLTAHFISSCNCDISFAMEGNNVESLNKSHTHIIIELFYN